MNQTKSFVASILSRDRPGIIESVSGAVFDLDGNIESISQTVVRGYFTLILIAKFPGRVEREALEEKMLQAGRRGEYSVIIREQPSEEAPPPKATLEETHYILTSNGPDAKGLITRITRFLAERSINVIDIAGEKNGDNLALVAQLEVPPGTVIKRLQEEASELGRRYGQSLFIQHIHIFTETNRI